MRTAHTKESKLESSHVIVEKGKILIQIIIIKTVLLCCLFSAWIETTKYNLLEIFLSKLKFHE